MLWHLELPDWLRLTTCCSKPQVFSWPSTFHTSGRIALSIISSEQGQEGYTVEYTWPWLRLYYGRHHSLSEQRTSIPVLLSTTCIPVNLHFQAHLQLPQWAILPLHLKDKYANCWTGLNYSLTMKSLSWVGVLKTSFTANSTILEGCRNLRRWGPAGGGGSLESLSPSAIPCSDGFPLPPEYRD